MNNVMRLIDGALSLFPNTPTKSFRTTATAVTPDIINIMSGKKKGTKRKVATVSRDDDALTDDDRWEENQTERSVTSKSAGRKDDLDDENSSDDDSSDEENSVMLRGGQLKSPGSNPSEVSDLSCVSRSQLIKMLEDTRRTCLDLQERGAMGPKKKKKKVEPETADEKKIDLEVTNILRYEIFRWLKFQKTGWNVWSNVDGTVCKMICDKVVNWPLDVTEEYKKKMWCKLFEPRLNRKLTLIKNKVTQRMKEIFMREFSIHYIHWCILFGSNHFS